MVGATRWQPSPSSLWRRGWGVGVGVSGRRRRSWWRGCRNGAPVHDAGAAIFVGVVDMVGQTWACFISRPANWNQNMIRREKDEEQIPREKCAFQ